MYSEVVAIAIYIDEGTIKIGQVMLYNTISSVYILLLICTDHAILNQRYYN